MVTYTRKEKQMKHLIVIPALMLFVSSTQAHESPAANIRHSRHYEWMIHHNAQFRHARMQKECGPLKNNDNLFHDCIDSFYR